MTGSERFHELLAEIGMLHDQKQADYGRKHDPFANVRASEEWGVEAWVGAMIRATDKLRRLQTFAQIGTLANEGVADSLKDLAVYSLIALVLFEDRHGRTSQPQMCNVSYAISADVEVFCPLPFGHVPEGETGHQRVERKINR